MKLLYVWHRRKERSTHSSWGLVAPISLDTQSGAQRAHASETIHAYCVNHSLNLVSLIILPPQSPGCHDSEWRPPITDDTINARPGDGLALTMWGRNVGHSMMEPVLVVEDYIDLLSKTAGRVIMLSACVHNERSGARFVRVAGRTAHPIFSRLHSA